MIGRWIAAALLFVAPALAGDDFEVMHGSKADSCTAQLTASRPSAGIAVEGGTFALSVWTTGVDHAIPQGAYTATVRIDDKPPVQLTGTGGDGVYLLEFDLDFGMALRVGKSLTLNVRGKDYAFDIAHLAEAMDAASSCAGRPKLADIYAASHAGMNGWEMSIRSPSGGCSAVRRGPTLDTVLMMMPDGTFGLMLGHGDWNIAPGKFHATVLLDGKAWEFDIPHPNERFFSILAGSENKAFFEALDTAKTIKWQLPWGDAEAKIDGLADIKARLQACIKNG